MILNTTKVPEGEVVTDIQRHHERAIRRFLDAL